MVLPATVSSPMSGLLKAIRELGIGVQIAKNGLEAILAGPK